MRILDCSALYTENFYLDVIECERLHWQDNTYYTEAAPRYENGLLLLNNTDITYWQRINGEKKEIYMPKGSIVYLPKGADYHCWFHDRIDATSSNILLNFRLFDEAQNPMLLSKEICSLYKSTPKLTQLFLETSALYDQAVQPFAAMKAGMYQILSELGQYSRHATIRSKGFSSIAPGIMYLESHINSNMSIEQIAKMCHVSSACFRRLFREYSGMSPIEYRLQAKMVYAKRLLQNRNLTVREVAEELQYDNTAYFCRIFKKMTGMTPTEYANS